RIVDLSQVGPNEYRLTLEGLDRFTLGKLVRSDPFWLAEGEQLFDVVDDPREVEALARSLRDHVAELAGRGGGALQGQLAQFERAPGLFADQLAAALGLPTDREMAVLRETNVAGRLKLVAELVNESKELADVKRKLDAEVRKEIGKGQREAILREQLKAIQ